MHVLAPPAPPRDTLPCALQAALAPLSGAWSLPIVGRLSRGSARFGQLREALVLPDGRGISSRVLASELRRLAEARVVERSPRGAGVAYVLTERGRQLVPLLDAVADWADPSAEGPPVRLSHRFAA